jgi:predicted O-methyltransferase YrrM
MLMAHNELTWKFINEFDVENEFQQRARTAAIEHGLDPIAPAVGAQIALVAAAANASNIVEIGTGLGLSALWLLEGAPEATLTSIDTEFEYHEQAREIFTAAGYPASRIRLITGKALDVLPRMNENSYDIVLVDGDPEQLVANVEHALRLVRVGGTVLIPHALWNGEVANPANRSKIPAAYRAIIKEANEADDVVVALSSAGDGLLQLTKIS